MINFTIGQRKGIRVSDKEPLYVLKIISDENEISWSKEGTWKKVISLKKLNLLVDNKIFDENFGKVRSTGKLLDAKKY